MKYRYSHIDRSNLQWMGTDNTCATLTEIRLGRGNLRGVTPFAVEFKYPISAISGENGSGKSTILAIAACAFHNLPNGFKLLDRKTTYYTFGDFFVQSAEEVPPQGIEIWYQIRCSNWRRLDPGLGWQRRKKRVGGRWNDYELRVKRNVAYFGIQRVVPHFERGPHKSYRGRFTAGALSVDVANRIREIASKVVGKNYDEYEIHKHSKYTLPMTRSKGIRYSGFNMGAGENAVFEILTALFEAGRGALLVIDEIELGLHEKAQRRLIYELKVLCQEFHCQVICSTHSHAILDALPPEARFYLENHSGKTEITPGISADWACGKLSGAHVSELCVFVEDEVAKSILEIWLPHATRERISIIPIGSDQAVLRQLSARYRENLDNCVAVVDGDKRNESSKMKSQLIGLIESQFHLSKGEFQNWVDERLCFLPGDSWPEKWLLDAACSTPDKSYLGEQWHINDLDRVNHCIDNANLAGKHREFFTLHQELQQPVEQVRADLIRFVKQNEPDAMNEIQECFNALIANST